MDFGDPALDEAEYHVLATGDATVNNAALATLDVQDMPNGFYQLRLTARDIGRRVSRAETVIEVRSDEKRAFLTIQSDLTVTVGDVVVNVARGYDSSRREREGDLGYGWRFLHREVDLRSSVPPTGYENQGLYAPYREGTRVYLATPDNQELAFQFQPQRQTEPGLVFYTPFWQPLETVATGWTLHTEDLRLMRGGNMFFEHETGRPYNPSSPFFTGTDFVLTAPDGTRYEIDAQLGIISQTDTNGNTVYIGDSGIAATSGQSVQLVYDGQGRVARLVAPDGRTVIYQYDAAGNLLAVREPATGQTDRFGYDALDPHLLRSTVTVAGNGTAVLYSDNEQPLTAPLLADLGAAASFAGVATVGSLSDSETDRYTFSVRESEILSAGTSKLFVRIVVERDGGDLAPLTPELMGVLPVSTFRGSDRAERLFAIEREGLYQLAVAGSSGTSGDYRLHIFAGRGVKGGGGVRGARAQREGRPQGGARGRRRVRSGSGPGRQRDRPPRRPGDGPQQLWLPRLPGRIKLTYRCHWK